MIDGFTEGLHSVTFPFFRHLSHLVVIQCCGAVTEHTARRSVSAARHLLQRSNGGERKKNTSVNKREKGWQWLEHPSLKSFWLLLVRDVPFAVEMRSNVGGHTVL